MCGPLCVARVNVVGFRSTTRFWLCVVLTLACNVQSGRIVSDDPSDREFVGFVNRPIGHPNFKNLLRAAAEVR